LECGSLTPLLFLFFADFPASLCYSSKAASGRRTPNRKPRRAIISLTLLNPFGNNAGGNWHQVSGKNLQKACNEGLAGLF
jgi:hypothetical protein